MSLHSTIATTTTHIPAGEPSLTELKAGQTLRILDLQGNQAVDRSEERRVGKECPV